MSEISFDNYLFRCSSLGGLMTYPEKNTLSAGPKTNLGNILKEELYNKNSVIQSKYLDKGIMCEEEGISMYNSVISKNYKKNTKRYNNEYITGEPDIISDVIIDIKTSWNQTTFPFTAESIPKKDYYWQLQGYMALTDKESSKLVYSLVDTPDELIYHELKNIRSKLGVVDLPEELEQEVWDNHKFDGINPKYRIKEFVVERNQDDIDAIYNRVALCREYLNNLINFLI